MYLNLNTVIIDDCEDTRFVLGKILSKVSTINVIGEAANGEDGLSLIREKKADLVFLDVQMPGIDGVEVAKRVAELNRSGDHSTYIIFATAFAQFAVEAFEYYAVDYLIKPYNLNRIKTAIDKVFDRFHPDRKIAEEEKLFIKTDGGIVLVNPSDICFITKEGRGTYLFTTSGKNKVNESMDSLEKSLENSTFKRCHKGYIVNLRRIRKICPATVKTYGLVLEGTKELAYMSKTCFKDIQELLGHKKRDFH